MKMDEIQDWDPYELTREAREMREQLTGMVDTVVKEANEEKDFLDELDRRKQENSDFCNDEKAEEWDMYEVAEWLIEKMQLPQYVMKFKENEINGDVLINDVTPEMLIHECAVKQIHSNKLSRAIRELKQVFIFYFFFFLFCVCVCVCFCLSKN